jgi:hypothetical protein
MATGKLIGNSTAGAYQSGNYALYDYFVAIATGIVSEVRLYTGAVTGYGKVAIYSNNSGHPGTLLASGSGACSVANAWNVITLGTPISIVSGTSYWLGTCVSADDVVQQYYPWPTTVYDMHYIAATYSTFTFPAAFDHTGHSSVASRMTTTTGWGVLVLSPTGISQVTDLGTPKLNFILYPSGIEQALAYGTPLVQLAGDYIYPPGIAQPIVIGTPEVIKLLQFISPTGIEQLVPLGTPEVIKLLQFIAPTGIGQLVTLGTPEVIKLLQFIAPTGIAQPIVIGTPSVAIYGFIGPSGIAQLVAIGSPTLLKYVWHVILDGQYIAESPDINRAYVIGRDAYGNPIYGEAQDSTEVALVGERLDFTQELAIPTTAQAGDVASAILAKMRLTGKRGVILIPPNCGQELFDVVQVSDSMANQSAVTFRVVGIRFEYNPKQARYAHKLILGAP